MKRIVNFIKEAPLFSAWIGFLLIPMAFGLYAGVQVLMKGLVLTDLSDRVPWGLWITVDLSSIASGGGAFILSAFVYLLGLKRYRPIARAAVLVGFLGYTSAMLALLMDIGRPDRFWHPVVFWNVHSLLWEITWCVLLYASVLTLEMLPTVLDAPFLARHKWLVKLGHTLHKFAPVLAVFGLGLSLLHQSSLGATYGVLVGRPIWFKPTMSVLFILSAAAGGLALTMTVTIIVGRLAGKHMVPPKLIRELAQVAGFAMLAYLYLKIWDWASIAYYGHNLPADRVEAFSLLSSSTPYDVTFWWGEVLLCGLIPAIIFLWPALRRDEGMLIVGGILAVAGLVIMRWNVTLSGAVIPMDWSPGVADIFPVATYNPTAIEWMVTGGIVAYWLMAFSLAVKFLPIYPEAAEREVAEEKVAATAAQKVA